MQNKFNCCFLIFFLPLLLFAQDSISPRKKIIKINTFAVAFQKISLQSEFLVKKKSSISMGVTYTPGRDISWVSEALSPFFSYVQFTSFALTPEWRFYLTKNKSYGNGFYIAPYFRYKYSALTTSFAFLDKTGFEFKIPIKYSINSFNLGLLTGYQWILKKGFTIDWWIAGGHFGTAFSSVGIDISGVTNILNSPEIKKQIDNTLNSTNLPFWVEPMIKNYLKQQDIGFDWVQPNFGLRTGFTIGYAF